VFRPFKYIVNKIGWSQVDTLTIDLTAILVDNPSISSVRTKVDLVLEDVGRGLSVENLEGGPRSLHRFNVTDVNALGCNETYQLNAHQSSIIVAIACSMANTRVLFSPLQPHELLASVRATKQSPEENLGTNLTGTGIAKTTGVAICVELAMDVTEILSLVDKLLLLRPFDRGKRTIVEHNILGAIFTYWEALKSTNGLTCYEFLYSAFQKAINADKGRRGEAFEAIASNMTDLSVSDIRKLKEFDNQVKQVIHSKGDFNLLEAGETMLAQKALVLKKAADSAILSRT
jgi:hypothetical protein